MRVSCHCCLVTAALPVHLKSHKSSLVIFFYQCTSKHHPTDGVSGETVCKLNCKLTFKESPGQAAVPAVFSLLSTALLSEHGNSFALTLVIFCSSREQWYSVPPGIKHGNLTRRN